MMLLRPYQRAAYVNAADQMREASRARYRADPHIWIANARNRKARMRGAEGRHTAGDIHTIFAAQRSKCAHCRISIRAGYHVDHINALSRGGSNWPRNLQLLCASCNLRKRAADPLDFARREGRLL